MAKRKQRRCSWRAFHVNGNGEIWLITQDIRRRRNFRTGERYLGVIPRKKIHHRARMMGVAVIFRLKHWK